jgi:S-adenosylmethionine-diacylglycerol 3-amino-3-carboxypropyl transferase
MSTAVCPPPPEVQTVERQLIAREPAVPPPAGDGDEASWLSRLMTRVFFRGIVFNMSWEDPEMDRQALCVQPEDTVLSITSGGCNPLNLLCQQPRRLIAIDGNPAQTALLELKAAGIRELDHGTFFDIFAARRPSQIHACYSGLLRRHLSPPTRQFWDNNLQMIGRGLYRYGKLGWFTRILRAYLHTKFSPRAIEEFFQQDDPVEQLAFYNQRVKRRLWGPFSKAFVNFRPLLYMAGVHPEQFKLVHDRHDMYDYVCERIEYLLTRVPARSNYFLAQALLGRFVDEENVPPYLLPDNYPRLQACVDRLEIVTDWLGPFLARQRPGSIDKFNLLDIFDWMSPQQVEQTFEMVLRAGRPGGRLIYRSGSYNHLPPASVQPRLQAHEALASQLLSQDRSGVYGSFYVYTIRP